MNFEGVYSGLWLAAEKLAFALGALIVGTVMGAFGFIESTDGVEVTQSHWAVIGIGVTYCGINSLIYLVSILAMMRVNKSEKAA
jgi:GPH family glycoside/pentoside/hexuronide:cation symporter